MFNRLTGMHQKVGNFPGVTVEKKSGTFKLDKQTVELVDLPGTYSLQPRSIDESVAANAINNSENPEHPDLVLVVVDVSHLKTSLYLALQVLEKGIPAILVMNMADQLSRFSSELDFDILSAELNVPIVKTNARDGIGVAELKHEILTHSFEKPSVSWSADTTERHVIVKRILQKANADGPVSSHAITQKIDDIMTHRVWGIVFFLSILWLMFQSIYSWSSYPMELIEWAFSHTALILQELLPKSFLTSLFIEGIWAGLGGVVIFIPQIAFLFLFVAILEQSGYMARVSFLADGWLRKFGLQGRSIVPLIGGVACAVPAIMAARTISNQKERLLTILVTPFMSCSARLPVYTLLIALVIPTAFQGLSLLMMYLLGVVTALLAALVLSKTLKNNENAHFIMELPDYRMPKLSNILIEITRKVSQFVFSAGKVIVVISVFLWLGASYGPTERMEAVRTKHQNIESQEMNAELLENSYIGILGKTIEPVIKPLGYDWKIGIALITSFAAREVFVGTMSTIYSVGSTDDESTSVREKMQAQIRTTSGKPLYDLPFGLSLMVFYAFAMQCMSTLAVVKAETGTWKWPAIQLIMMTGLAYFSSLLVYQLVSLL